MSGTTVNDVREALYQHFAAGWAAQVALQAAARGIVLPTPPFALGDEGIDPPNALWVRMSVRHGPTSQETLGTCGNRNFDRTGRVFVQCFDVPGGDERKLDIAAEAARNLFEARTIGAPAIRFNAVAVTELGVVEEGRWQASTAEAPFSYTTRK